MQDIKICKDCYVPKDNIKLYISYISNSVKEDVRKKRKEGRVFDYTGGKKILSVIYLTTGELILVNTTIETLFNRMNPLKELG